MAIRQRVLSIAAASGRVGYIVLEDMDDVRVHVDALLVELGRRTFQVLPEAIDHPERCRLPTDVD